MTGVFVVIVGRPWDRDAEAAEATMRARLRSQVALWLRQETNATRAEAEETANRVTADQLPADRRGVPVAALTAAQLRTYLRLVREVSA